MRVIFAGLFVFAGICAVIFLVGPALEHSNSALLSLGMGASFVVLIIAAYFLFNIALPQKGLVDNDDQILQKLEEDGLLQATSFEAVRAFTVAEYEDEGSHYFIELCDHRILYLNGQYLYDYEEPYNEGGITQTRRFPCTAFTVRRHRTEGWVADVQCGGDVFEPEEIEPSDDYPWFEIAGTPGDGDVLLDRTYDDLKEAIRGVRH